MTTAGLICILVVGVAGLIAAFLFMKKQKPAAPVVVDAAPVEKLPIDWQGVWMRHPGNADWVKENEFKLMFSDHEYDRKDYVFKGTTNTVLPNIHTLPQVEWGEKVVYVNGETLFAWTGKFWVARCVTGIEYLSLSFYLKAPGYEFSSSDSFHIKSISLNYFDKLIYDEWEIKLFNWVYMFDEYPGAPAEKDAIANLYYNLYAGLKAGVRCEFDENLTRAKTSVILRLAEEVIDNVLDDGDHIRPIRSELESRLRNMKTIEEVKELLFK